jgi:hypothetical protein
MMYGRRHRPPRRPHPTVGQIGKPISVVTTRPAVPTDVWGNTTDCTQHPYITETTSTETVCVGCGCPRQTPEKHTVTRVNTWCDGRITVDHYSWCQ